MLFQIRLQRVLALSALALLLFVLPARLSAQWTTGAGGLIYYTGGNVAIGATSSSNPLLVADNDSNYQLSNAAGIALPTTSASIPITVQPGQQPSLLTLVVTGVQP